MILATVVYLLLRSVFNIDGIAEIFATIIAIITLVAFWLEYNDNKILNESQFIISLNDQFVSDERMYTIEWELEKFFYKYKKRELTKEYMDSFRKQFDIENERRQYLVNYLVHMESLAALVNNGTLKIDKIANLMSYRYFIVMNNPVVQEIELKQYSDYYTGCFNIYENWVKVLEKNGMEIPMYKDFPLLFTEN